MLKINEVSNDVASPNCFPNDSGTKLLEVFCGLVLAAGLAPQAHASQFGICLLPTSFGTAGWSSAEYATLSFGGCAAGFTQSLGTGAVLSPTSLATGLTTAALTLSQPMSAGGVATGTVVASSSASLDQGVLHITANSEGGLGPCGGTCMWTGGRSSPEVLLEDTLHFTITNGASSAIVTFHVHMQGTVGLEGGATTPGYGTNTTWTIGPGVGCWQSQAGGYGSGFQPCTSGNGGFLTSSFSNQSATGFDFTGTFSVTNGQANTFFATLQADNSGGAFNDETASYSLSLPSNLTVTSDSGVLFTQQQKPPRDFRGIGRSDAILYDPLGGQEYTALSNGDGTFHYVPNPFTAGFDILRTGDYNGDGKADLVVYNSHSGLAYIGMSNGDGTFAFQSLFWSPGYNFVEAGDLNGDGKTDFALYNSATGTMYTAISNSNGIFSYKYTLITSGYTFVRLADFTGDGKADIFLYNVATGQANLGVGDGAGGFTFHALSMSPGYNLADLGDLNGDGKMDLIVYNSANGNTATGISDGAGGLTFSPLLFTSGFTSVRLADYTGDGKADITVYNKNTAAAYFGIGNGSGNFTFQSLFWSPAYDVVEPQDVNGDGKIDIVLYNSTSSGTEYAGISNGNGGFTYTYSLWGPGKLLAR